MKIRTRLRALILLSLLPVGLFGVTAAYFAVEKERQTTERDMRDRATALMRAVENEIRTSINALEILAGSSALENNDLAGFRVEAQRMLAARSGNWGNILVHDVRGQQMVNLLRPVTDTLPRAQDLQSVIEVAQHRRPALGRIRMANILKRPVFSLRVPVIRGDETAYVLTAVIEGDSIARIVEKQDIPESWTVAVLDQDYRFVFRRPAIESANEFASESLRDVLSNASQGWDRGELMDGEPVYRAYQRSSVGNWSTSVAVPSELVDRSMHNLWLLIGGFAVLIALALWFALRLATRISGPIMALAAAAPALSRGDVSAIPPAGSVNETRQLSQSLKQAAMAIRERDEQQRLATQELRAADRAKDEFLAILGHELRNPLASVANAAQLLKLTRDPGAIDNIGAILTRQSEHMIRIIDDLLETGRLTSGKMRIEREPLDLAQVADDLLSTWHSGSRFRQHTVSTRCESAWVWADRTRIEQILSNLLDNAVKYTPPGGHIEVTVSRDEEHAILQVSDNGDGMQPELIDRVFDLFVQGEQHLAAGSEGLGIGLTMAKQLVDLHGGTIKASSEGPGKGTCFTVRLPVFAQPQ